MLDSYIIKRIQEERERARDGGLRPLRIERHPPPPPPRPEPEEDQPKRGSVIIDFRL